MCGCKTNKIKFSSFTQSIKPRETCDLWSSYTIISGSDGSLPWTYFMKCSSKYFLNTVLFDQPVSLTVPEAPGVTPSRSSGLIIFPTNTKYGGIAVPKSLPDHRTVTVPGHTTGNRLIQELHVYHRQI